MHSKKNSALLQSIPKNIPVGTEVLRCQNISKSFGRVDALTEVNFTLRAGEVHALVGGNGAGKSTLVNIICGSFRQSSGELYVFGKKRKLSSPGEARDLGIGTVHQKLALIDTLDVTANLFLGRELIKPPPLSWFSVMDLRKMRDTAIAELKRLHINIPSVDEWAMRLSGGQRQGIVCAKALMGKTPILVMDEPTAALGIKEGAQVIDLVKKCRDDGAAVLLISHNIKEIFAMSQRITVLRLGQVVAEGIPTEALSEEEVVGLITGAVEFMEPREQTKTYLRAQG